MKSIQVILVLVGILLCSCGLPAEDIAQTVTAATAEFNTEEAQSATETEAARPTNTQTDTPAPTDTPTPTNLPTTTGTATLTTMPLLIGPDNVQTASSTMTNYYDVTGITSEEILRSMELNGPSNDDGDSDPDNWIVGNTGTTWFIDDADAAAAGVPPDEYCWITSVSVKMEIVFTIPKHLQPESLDKVLAGRWEKLVEDTEKHEQRHAEIDITSLETIKHSIAQLPRRVDCDIFWDTVDNIREEVEQLYQLQHDEFHTTEELICGGLIKPIEQDIQYLEDNIISSIQQEMDSYDSKMDAVESQLHTIEQEHSSRKSRLDAITARLDAIEVEYPSLELPEGIYEEGFSLQNEYNQLFNQYSQLIEQYDLKTKEYNALLSSVNLLVDQYNATVEELNSLIEEKNWAACVY